jgi:hypothetical protein
MTIRINFDRYTIEEIKQLIKDGIVSEEEVIAFYGNEWWDHNGETEEKEDA